MTDIKALVMAFFSVLRSKLLFFSFPDMALNDLIWPYMASHGLIDPSGALYSL
jgi:hypothetical protein